MGTSPTFCLYLHYISLKYYVLKNIVDQEHPFVNHCSHFFHFQSGRPGSGRPGSARSRLGSAHGRQGKNDYLYKVTVITGDRKNAGTDSKVSTILIACDVIEIFMDIGHVLAQFCRGCNHSVSFVIRNHLARVICSYGLILFLTSSKGVAISTFQVL